MKKMFAAALIAALALGAGIADAKRLGSGSSVGRQSSQVSRSTSAPANQAAPAPAPQPQPAAQPSPQPAAQPAAQPSRFGGFGGLLGGIAAGVGLGYLFSHLGGGGFGGLLMLLVALGLGLFLFRRMAGAPGATAPAAAGPGQVVDVPTYREVGAPSLPSYERPGYTPAIAAAPAAPWGVPAGFDTEAFLRNAKANFVRLQGDWDQGNLDDLRELTTAEMFTELSREISNRVGRDRTEVVTLDAQLLGIEQTDHDHLASVRFSGMLREVAGAPAEAFTEVWNLSRPIDGSAGWLLAGIQQVR